MASTAEPGTAAAGEILWRLAKPEYAPGLDGEGAQLVGGRWNSPGLAAVYCSAALSLAVLESFVHLPRPLRASARLPALIALKIALPGAATFLEIPAKEVPDIGDMAASRALGDRWLAAREALALRVPSVIVPQEWNTLLNPAHPLAREVRVIDQIEFRFDPRMGG